MKCKDNSVLYVKEIMPQQSPRSCRHMLFVTTLRADGTHKGLDNPSNMHIIIITHETRCFGDLINAQQSGQKVQEIGRAHV